MKNLLLYFLFLIFVAYTTTSNVIMAMSTLIAIEEEKSDKEKSEDTESINYYILSLHHNEKMFHIRKECMKQQDIPYYLSIAHSYISEVFDIPPEA